MAETGKGLQIVEPSTIVISTHSVKDFLGSLKQLGELLRACVMDGANIGFVLPFSTKDAEAFWQDNVLSSIEGDRHLMLVARCDEKIVGTVQLDWNTMPNQPHRAEVKKLMVHPDFRRLGIARKLMTFLEANARSLGLTLLTMDTQTGGGAEPLYLSLGYNIAGIVPDYCLDPIDKTLQSTTFMYKRI